MFLMGPKVRLSSEEHHSSEALAHWEFGIENRLHKLLKQREKHNKYPTRKLAGLNPQGHPVFMQNHLSSSRDMSDQGD